MNTFSSLVRMPAPLIPLVDGFRGPSVSAREFYQFLGHHPKNYTHWVKANLLHNDFALENEDWAVFVANDENPRGRPSRDYVLSLSFAKKLAMRAESARGEQARQYFLACERAALQALDPPPTPLPTAPGNYPDALRALADNVEQRLAAETRMAVMEPKVALYDRAMESADVFDMLEVPRLLKLPCGRNELYEKLRQAGVIMKGKTIPYQRWMEADPPYFKVVATSFTDACGRVHVSSKTLVTPRGLEFIDRKLGELDRPGRTRSRPRVGF